MMVVASGAIEPDLVGQVRRADLTIALARHRHDRRRNCRRRSSCRAARSALGSTGRPATSARIVGDGVDVPGASACRRGRRPACAPDRRLGVGRADAVTDGVLDVVELAAPQPVVVVQVGIALGAAAARAMARRAVIAERGAALRAREVEQLRIGRDLSRRRRAPACPPSAARCAFRVRQLADDRRLRATASRARPVV